MPPTPYHDPTVWAWQLRDSQRDPTATSRRDNGLPSARISGQRGVQKCNCGVPLGLTSARVSGQRGVKKCSFGVPLGLPSARRSGQRGVKHAILECLLGSPALEDLAREVFKNAILECLLGSQRSSIWPERCPKMQFRSASWAPSARVSGQKGVQNAILECLLGLPASRFAHTWRKKRSAQSSKPR